MHGILSQAALKLFVQSNLAIKHMSYIDILPDVVYFGVALPS
jgi:hypothetical protein